MRSIQIEKVAVHAMEPNKITGSYVVSGELVCRTDVPVNLKLVRCENVKVEDFGRRFVDDVSEHLVIEETFWPGGLSKGGIAPFSFSAIDCPPTLNIREQDAGGKTYQLEVNYHLLAVDPSSGKEITKITVNFERKASQGPKISMAEKLPVQSAFCCCLSEQAEYVNFLVNADSSAVEAGKPFLVFLEIYNYSTEAVKSISIRLSREIRAGSISSLDIITKLDFNGIESGKYMPSFPVNIQIPAKALPTLRLSQFKCTYFADVTASMDGASPLRLKIPVKVVPLLFKLIPRVLRKSG